MTIKVKPGDEVKPGDTVLIYEAMKMENDLASEMGGKVKKVLVAEGDVMATDQPLIEFEGSEVSAPAQSAPQSGKGEEMLAPMGGTILEFKVKPGQAVKAGDTILVYEAMKMENNLVAERDGVVEALLLNDGDVMATDQPILRWSAGASKAEAAPAPKPAPQAQAHKPMKIAPIKVEPVSGFDESKALHPVEGGSGKAPDSLKNYQGEYKGINLPDGTTLDISISPDGTVNIRISCGK